MACSSGGMYITGVLCILQEGRDEPQPWEEPQGGPEAEPVGEAGEGERGAVDEGGGGIGGRGWLILVAVCIAAELVRVFRGGAEAGRQPGGDVVDGARRVPPLPHVRHALGEGPQVPQVQEHGAGGLPPRQH